MIPIFFLYYNTKNIIFELTFGVLLYDDVFIKQLYIYSMKYPYFYKVYQICEARYINGWKYHWKMDEVQSKWNKVGYKKMRCPFTWLTVKNRKILIRPGTDGHDQRNNSICRLEVVISYLKKYNSKQVLEQASHLIS